MKIKADTEGRAALSKLADIALRAAGIQVHPLVVDINSNFELLEDEPKQEEKDADGQ